MARRDSAPAIRDTYKVISRGYGPVGKVAYRRPTFGWTVTPSNGARVTGATLKINSVEVAVTYDSQSGELSYTPSECLKPGTYDIEIALRVNNAVTFRKSWTTEIPSDATIELPKVSTEQLALFASLNRLRATLKLAPYTLDPVLAAAADSHARYLAKNSVFGHSERAELPGYSGEDPSARASVIGFSGSVWETVGYQSSGFKGSVEAIFDAPYHRILFMHPAAARVGTGYAGAKTVVDGAIASGQGVVTSPAADEKDVRRSWTNSERPDPLRRFPGMPRIIGYPIVFSSFGGEGKLIVRSAKLTMGGQDVPVALDIPSNDDSLTDSAILIPTQPFEPKTTYTVEIVATLDGRDVGRRWNFTTE